MKHSALVLALALTSCAPHPVVPLGPVQSQIIRADTVAVGRHRCIFLTLKGGSHALTPEQPKPCGKAFLKWAVRHE